MKRRNIFSKNSQWVLFLTAFIFIFSQAYCDLIITPAEDYFCSGAEGGPFSPPSKSYVLTNQSGTAITWGSSDSVDWIECSPEWGNLDPNETVEIFVLITSGAESLVAGEYIEDVIFTDITNDVDEVRQIVLSVGSAASGPIAWWKLDGDATDSSGNGYDGTIYGDPNWVAGVYGGAIDLDGVDDYIAMGDEDAYSFTSGLDDDEPFTISAWINFEDMSGTVIVSKFDWTTGNTNTEYLFHVGALDKINFQIFDNSTGSSIGRKYDATITDYENKWTHFTASYDGSKMKSGMKIYINGIRVDDLDLGSGTYSGMENTDSSLLVGTRTETTGDLGTFLNGVIDDVRIYDRALTQAEIAELAGIGQLAVLPNESFGVSGEPGGPFTPAYKDYTLNNLGNEALYWGIDALPDWLDTNTSFGSLDPNESATVRVFLTADADLLDEGLYTAAVTFNNLSSVQDPVVRDVNLDIQVIHGIWVSPESFNITLTQGTTQQDVLTIGNDGAETLNFSLRSRTIAQPASVSTLNNMITAPEEPQKVVFDVQQALSQEHEPSQVLVRFAPDHKKQFPSKGILQQKVSDVFSGATITKHYKIVSGLSLVQLPNGVTVQEALESFNQREDILYVQPNYRVYADAIFPNDARFDDLWGLYNTGQTGGFVDADIDGPEAWTISTGSDSVVVAVIDTGVDYNHEDLAANMWINQAEYAGTSGVDDDGNGYIDDIYGYDFVNNDGNPMDDHYHGTHCAGTIGAIGNNGKGVTGVCWNVKIMAVKFLDSGGGGWTSDAIESVEYATLMGADLMSNSWGGGSYDQGLKDAIDAAGAIGILFVAAAGNDSVNNDTYPHYPSSYTSDNVISVMATDDDDNRSSFSNWGLASVDIGAPGTSILSCEPGNQYQYLSGTSMATPHVAGACALLLSINPSLKASEVKDLLLDSSDSISSMAGKCVSEGRLNINNAILETTVTWIEFDIEQGQLNGGGSADIIVTFDASGLTPGVYLAEILILSDDPARPVLAIPVDLTVLPDPLEVTPETGFDPNGLEGGPFEPNSIVYSLTNIGDVPLDWSVQWQVNWLSVDQTAGILAPDQSVDILVSLDSDTAAELLPGLHEDSLIFNNLNIGSIQRREVALSIRPPDKFTEIFENDTAQLQKTSIIFRRDDSASYYAACVGKESVESMLLDPNEGTFVSVGDDDYTELLFTDGKQFNFYGTWYDGVYIGSNGYLTFGQGDSEYDPTLENHFTLPRISALFTDLTPADNQSISYIQMVDRFVVTYQNVPIFGDKTATNSFQVELFFVDGTIRISYLNLNASTVIAGLSDGNGLPGFFEESDFSSYINCCDCGDTDGDGVVDLSDLYDLALVWLNSNCVDSDWCNRNDFDRNGQVDLLDWSMMSENWQKVDYAWSEPEFLLELNGKAWTEPQYLSELDDSQGNKAYAPCLSRDGLSIYFSRYIPSLGYKCIVQAQRDTLDEFFTEEKILTELAVTGMNVSSPWISEDGHRLYYHEVFNLDPVESMLKMAEWNIDSQQWIPEVKTFSELHYAGHSEGLVSLTADELNIFWQSTRPDGTGALDLWMATRVTTEDPFGNIRELAELNTANNDGGPCISPDGLTLYFNCVYRTGGDEGCGIYKATRLSLSEPFGNVELIDFPGYEMMWEEHSYADFQRNSLYFQNNDAGGIFVTAFEPDSAQYFSQNMCLSSDQLDAFFTRYIPDEDSYCVVEATRTDPELSFTEERIHPLLNVTDLGVSSVWISDDKLRLYFHEDGLIKMSTRSDVNDLFIDIVRTFPELQGDGGTASPTLTPDELTIAFHSSQTGSVTGSSVNLWIASRNSINEPFTNKRPLDEINSVNAELNPWLMADGLTLYFCSYRDNLNDCAIYKSSRNSILEQFGPVQKVTDGVGVRTGAPYVSPEQTKLYFYDELLDGELQKGTWKMEFVPVQKDCLTR